MIWSFRLLQKRIDLGKDDGDRVMKLYEKIDIIELNTMNKVDDMGIMDDPKNITIDFIRQVTAKAIEMLDLYIDAVPDITLSEAYSVICDISSYMGYAYKYTKVGDIIFNTDAETKFSRVRAHSETPREQKTGIDRLIAARIGIMLCEVNELKRRNNYEA